MENEMALIRFLHRAEGLKNELRNGHTSTGKRESVAEHTWRMTLMILICSSSLDQKISIEKTLKMAIVHDLAELVTGDTPYFIYEGKKALKETKAQEELEAMHEITDMLPQDIGSELLELWKEYETGNSYEAKFVQALDKMEAQMQHNEMDFCHWNDHDKKYALNRLDSYCNFDPFLTRLKNILQEESRIKMENRHVKDDI